MGEGHVRDVGIQGIQFSAERLAVGCLGIAHRGGAQGSKRLEAAVGIGQLRHTFRQPQSGKVRGTVALGQVEQHALNGGRLLHVGQETVRDRKRSMKFVYSAALRCAVLGGVNFNNSFITFSFLSRLEMCPHSISEVQRLSRERFSGVKNARDRGNTIFQP